MQIIRLFGSEGDLYNQFAAMSFRIFLSMMLLCCVQKSTSIFLQALGKPIMSMTLSLLRDFILSVPLILILPGVFDLGVVGPLYSGPNCGHRLLPGSSGDDGEGIWQNEFTDGKRGNCYE